MKTAIELIADERKRQIEVEGWTPEHDDKHSNGELSDAAAVYSALPTNLYFHDKHYDDQHRFIELWPFEKYYLKPTPHDRIRELTKAGALIIAEIERLQRFKQAIKQIGG